MGIAMALLIWVFVAWDGDKSCILGGVLYRGGQLRMDMEMCF